MTLIPGSVLPITGSKLSDSQFLSGDELWFSVHLSIDPNSRFSNQRNALPFECNTLKV